MTQHLLQEARPGLTKLLLQAAFARLGEDLVRLAGVPRLGLGLLDVDGALAVERFLGQVLRR